MREKRIIRIVASLALAIVLIACSDSKTKSSKSTADEYQAAQAKSVSLLNHTIKGRPFFLYTDGLNEAENQQQEQFGDSRMLQLLRQTSYDSSKQVIANLTAEIEKHRDGAEPNDDLTMFCIHLN